MVEKVASWSWDSLFLTIRSSPGAAPLCSSVPRCTPAHGHLTRGQASLSHAFLHVASMEAAFLIAKEAKQKQKQEGAIGEFLQHLCKFCNGQIFSYLGLYPH